MEGGSFDVVRGHASERCQSETSVLFLPLKEIAQGIDDLGFPIPPGPPKNIRSWEVFLPQLCSAIMENAQACCTFKVKSLMSDSLSPASSRTSCVLDIDEAM